MLDVNFIRNLLKGYVEKEIEHFIIYPFGVNGVNVKNILKDYFAMEPCFIVDNGYAKYNSAIADKDTLKKVYQKDMYIILTIEKPDLNTAMLEELLEFVPASHIINLVNEEAETKEKKNNYIENKIIGSGFFVRDFLPLSQTEMHKKMTDKVRVRIIHNHFSSWNAINTICEEFEEDTLFDLLIIITATIDCEKSIEQVKNQKYHYVMWDEYQVDDDEPDIIILDYPFDQMAGRLGIKCRKYAKLVIVASMQLVKYMDSTIESFWELQHNAFGKFQPDYYLYDSLIYKELIQSNSVSNKIIEMGNAKFDGIYCAMQKKEYKHEWLKLKGKKTLLWAAVHGVSEYKVNSGVTFDLYAKHIFEYVSNNPEMGIIIRLHSTFIKEMLEVGLWSSYDLNYVKEYCDNAPNIVFDDTDNYDKAFSIADGFITDASCGIICSALPTLKPICITYRSKSQPVFHKELMENYYSAYEGKDIIDFFEMIKRGQDPMEEARKNACKKYIKSFDGKNGWRIKEFIKRKFFEL